MKGKLPLIAWLAAAALAAAQEETPPRANLVVEGAATAAGEVVSRSKQFKVSGGDGVVRGSVAILAEETKDDLLRLTEEREEWKVPIRIALFGAPGDASPARPIAMELLYTDQGYDLRVYVHLGHGIERERFAAALTSALIYERSLRNRKPDDTEMRFYVPPWLVDGLREATAWRLGRSDRRNYEALFKRGGVYKMDELFGVDEKAREGFDAATRIAFQTSAGALVMALLEQPQGREGFRSFLTQVAGFQGEMPVLMRRHFPDLNLSETSLAKWWALQMATKGTAPLADSLSVVETETSLEEVLRLHFRDAQGNAKEQPLSAWPEVAAMEEPQRAEAVRPAQDGLVRLSYRSFPSYRALLLDYQAVLSSLQAGKTEQIPERLQSLEASRELMRAKAERARDFMDWFEITRARETSGEFDDYLRLKDRLKQQPNERQDSMSLYLDRMDALFSRAQEPPKQGGMPPLLPPQ